MKILWLTEFFPLSEKAEITGGVEARCFYVGKELKKLGIDLTVIADRTDGKRWSQLSFLSIIPGILFLFRVFLKTLKASFSDFDLIEGTNYTVFFPAWLVGKIRRKPIVFWYPDVFIGEWTKNLGAVGILGEIWEKFILKLPVDTYISISNSTAEKLIREGVDAKKIKIIHCGVDFKEINLVAKSSSNEKKYDICLVNRLVAYKKTDVAVDAIAIVKKDLPELKAIIVGQGPERANLEKQVTKLNLQNHITFTGFVKDHKEVLSYILNSKIFCFPSSAEGFGIAPIEAAALGVPSITSDIPVLKEIGHNGEAGFSFKLNDSQDLASKILTLLKNKQLYLAKRDGGLKLAKKYDWEKITEETVAIYQELI